jgi:hypothetical protein
MNLSLSFLEMNAKDHSREETEDRSCRRKHGGIMCDIGLIKPARLSGPYRAKRLCMFAQAKAWAEFSWPFGPSASRQEIPSTSVILPPEGP